MSINFTNICVEEVGPNFNICCRICLDAFSTGINLKNSHILELLEYCVGFKVDIQYTPFMICGKCKEKIEEFAEFKARFIKTELYRKQSSVLKNLKSDKEKLVNGCIHELTKEEKTVSEQDPEELNSEALLLGVGYEDEKSLQGINNSDQSPVIDEKLNAECSVKDGREERHSNVKCNGGLTAYKCVKCKKKYKSYKGLLKHKCKKICCKKSPNSLKKENEVSTKECGICDKPFSDLKEHIKQHWLSNDLQCELCNYCGKDFAHMVTHRYTHYPKMVLYCIACGKRSLSLLALQFHFRSLHLKKPGGFCTFCDKTFERFKTWKKHHRIHTESYKLYVCDHCGYKFLYKHEMETHMASHMETRHYVCEACGKGFKRISALKEHIYNIHETRKPVTCSHCNKVYKCENKLKIHLRNVATEKPFVCEVCSKQFPTEKVLKRHMFWHTGERPFGCEVCGSKYKAKATLKVHMRKHSGVLPYTCANCGKNFACSAQLKRHKSVHTGVRAHKCTHCEMSFHLKKHLLEHTVQHKNVEGVKLET